MGEQSSKVIVKKNLQDVFYFMLFVEIHNLLVPDIQGLLSIISILLLNLHTV